MELLFINQLADLSCMLSVQCILKWVLNAIFEILFPLRVNIEISKAIQTRIQWWKRINSRISSFFVIIIVQLIVFRLGVGLVQFPQGFFVNFICNLLDFVMSDDLSSRALCECLFDFLFSNRLQNFILSFLQFVIFLSNWLHYAIDCRFKKLVVPIRMRIVSGDAGLSPLRRSQ